MKRGLVRKGLLGVLVGAVVLSLAAGPACAEPRTLRFQVNYPGTSYGGSTMKYFAEQVEKESGGQLKVQLFFVGQILKAKEAFSALDRGMVDGLYSALIYYAGVVKEANWEWLPFTWSNAEECVDLYMNKGLLKVMQEALAQHGVRYLVPIPMGTLGFLTKFEATTMADFKGKKIRGIGTQAKIIQLLGATPVSLSPHEQYTSLQRGTIEGTIYPWYTIGTYKFHEVVDNVISPGIYSPCVIDLMMNLKVWDSLSPELKQAMTKAAETTMHWTTEKVKAWDKEGIDMAVQHKVKINKLTPAALAQFRKATLPLWEKTAQRSELSAKAVKILQDNLK